MKRLAAIVLLGVCMGVVHAHEAASSHPSPFTLHLQEDTLTEITVSAPLKQFGKLEEQPMSAQALSVASLRRTGEGASLKSMAQSVPNLFYPEYGSRLTPALYIRGIGSRANTPVVGLYVDDVALMEKSSFDFSLQDAERVEVLRGPQSTLYGRNTMGGLLKVYTLSPLQQGNSTEVRLGTSTKDALREAYARHSHVFADVLGVSLSGFYRGDNGYNRNTLLDRRSNGSEAGGGRLRLTYRRTPRFLLDFQTSGEYSDEDAYDYASATTGLIQQNFLGGYRRTLVNSSLKLETRQRRFTLTSVTAYQYLRDRMRMDQDYTQADLFRLEQRQRSHALSEELVLKGTARLTDATRRTPALGLEWTAGGYVGYQSLHTNAPVTFQQDGISNLIQSGIDQGMDAVNSNPALVGMGMSMSLGITDGQLAVPGRFDTPVTNAAAFGQATLKNVLLRGLDLTAGLRLDYEHRSMDYLSEATIHSHYYMTHGPRIPAPDINLDLTTHSGYEGRLSDNQTRLLPRIALSYRFGDEKMVYASVSEGLRSGGYNYQMFSDLIQASMRNDMMRSLAEEPSLAAYMSRFMPPVGDNPSADSATIYKPERSWNYEVGTHLRLLDGHLTAQAALFLITVHDQQITRFAAGNGLGRQVLNAGRSRSLGLETSLSGWFLLAKHPLRLAASYGFTHATFTDYDAGEADGQAVDYDGNYLPFAPRHTLALSADYQLPIRSVTLDLGLSTTGQGRTYWTEDNQASQAYYQLLGAHVSARYKCVTLDLWGRNLTNRHYTPFYFVSRGQGFSQLSRPRQFGLTLGIRL